MKDTKEVYLTEQGLIDLKAELDELKNVRRPIVIEALKDARALGDLSENAEYDAARNEQAIIETQIAELEKTLENAVVINNVNKDVVSIGTKVRLEFCEDNEVEEYSIVGTRETDPFENKISNESPIAQAIIGKKKNDIATVKLETSDYDVKILEIL